MIKVFVFIAIISLVGLAFMLFLLVFDLIVKFYDFFNKNT